MTVLSDRTLRWLAWSIVGLYFVLSTAGLSLQVFTKAPFTNIPVFIILIIFLGVWIVTGALIVSRHPRHPVGWLLCAGVFSPAIDMFAAGYVAYDTYASGSLPGVALALVWLRLGLLAALPLVAYTLMILLFPDGRLPSPGWRVASWMAVGTLLVYLPLQALEPGPADPMFAPNRINPLGVGASLWASLKPLMWMTFSILMLCYAAALVSLISRLRQARGDERQQVKWLLFPAGLYGVALLLHIMGGSDPDNLISGIGLVLAQFAIVGVIIAVAFSIFRYRLYDIDLIIRRTLVYTVLTTTLAVFYLGLVIVLEAALRLLVGEGSQIATVISTLAIATLFAPLRRRVQEVIDRRFYRRKYNAEQALAEFAATTRTETDLEALTAQVVGIVQKTMQPERWSLWLREE